MSSAHGSSAYGSDRQYRRASVDPRDYPYRGYGGNDAYGEYPPPPRASTGKGEMALYDGRAGADRRQRRRDYEDRDRRRRRSYSPARSGRHRSRDRETRERSPSVESVDPPKRNWMAVLPIVFGAITVLLEPRGGWHSYHGGGNPRHRRRPGHEKPSQSGKSSGSKPTRSGRR